MSVKKFAVVIPARMGSSRFPGKPLIDLAGKPMIQWVVEAVRAADLTERIIVATPDREIFECARGFGCEAAMTRAEHPTGTARLAELTGRLEEEYFLNVQSDEPLIWPSTIRACAQRLVESDESMSSVYCRCPDDEIDNPAVVKVVTDENEVALYFSRYPIPYPRSPRLDPVKKHVGIYGFTRGALVTYSGWVPTKLETSEGLEQLRFLEHGVRIAMGECEGAGVAVDTPEQAEIARKLLLERRT